MHALSAAVVADDEAVETAGVDTEADGTVADVDVTAEAEVEAAGALLLALVPLLLDPHALRAMAATPKRAAACMDFFTDSSSGPAQVLAEAESPASGPARPSA
jgi:hypothetical protein